ncbi:MAG: hypothetical protein ACOY94_12865 [Bacillota bacterium]
MGILLLLVLLVLFLPLDVSLRLDSDLQAPTWDDELAGQVRWLIRLRWGWVVFAGLWEGENVRVVRSEMRILGLRLRPGGKKAARKKKERKKKKRSAPDLELIWAVVEEAARFLRRLIERFGFRFEGDLTYGFSDPSLTGWCEAIRWSVGNPVPIRLEPEFERPALLGWATTHGRLYGYQVAAAVLKAIRNPVIKDRLSRKIRFKPLRYILLGG